MLLQMIHFRDAVNERTLSSVYVATCSYGLVDQEFYIGMGVL